MAKFSETLYPLLPWGLRRDVCLSYPKSGRTWLRLMLGDLGLKLGWKHGPGLFHLHVPAQALDDAILQGCRRVVFLYRDPRDTVVSAWHHATTRSGDYDGPISSFLRDPGFGIEKVATYNLVFLEAATRFPMLPVSYEALRQTPVEGLARICAFFGHKATPAALAAAVDHNEFTVLKQCVGRGDVPGNMRSLLAPQGQGGEKVRKGKVGGWRDELSAADIDLCDDVLGRLNYAARLEQLARGHFGLPPSAPMAGYSAA